MGKKAIWLSYDFGLKGDYSGLYTWLDNNNAVECGSGLAYFRYDYSKILSFTKENIDEIAADIRQSVKLSKTDRLYLIWKDSITNKVKGEFVNGTRRQSPWEGYGRLSVSKNIIDGEE